jgi:sugar/nucleoside kinase (ribokinase family)
VGGLSTGYLGNERPRPTAGAGGSALLSAVGAWLVGAEAAVCAVIAPDFPGDQIRIITRAGIDLSRVRLASPDELSSGDLEPSADQLASVSPNWAVHLCGLSTRRQAAIIHRVNQRVALLTLDTIYIPARLEPERKDVLSLAAQCDAFLPGRAEVSQLWPGEPPREVLRELARSGARAAVIKLGLGGSIGIREGAIIWIPAFPIKASADARGGDAYAGAFAATFAIDRDLARAMAWGAAAASVVMESSIVLDVLSEYGRKKTESRARSLLSELRQGT